MPTLRELQRSFAAALHDGSDAAAFAQVRPGGTDAREGIAIYRHRLREVFRRALGAEFPVTERLVGRVYFARLARDFQCAHRSRAGALEGICARSYGKLHFELHPACRLISSPYPALAIWRANQDESAAPDIIDLGSEATRVLVQRHARGIEIHDLSAAEFALLEKIAQDYCLGTALDAARRQEENFDLGLALRRAVAFGAFIGARLHPP